MTQSPGLFHQEGSERFSSGTVCYVCSMC